MTPDSPTKLTAEQLDDRTLPSATLMNLTTAGAVATTDGFIARQTDAQPTGTGFINSFVRVQGAASGGGAEQGYNTTARPLQFDENKSPQFTRGLTLGQVPVVTVNGVAYREFLLDVNQKSSSPLLSVDEVRIFLGASSNMTGYDPTSKTLAGQAAVFDMDANGDVSLILNARLNSGSGSGDMFLLVPNAVFAGADANASVYLYSKMGGVAGATANGGFEEWAVRSIPNDQPTTGNSSLSGAVFLDYNGNGLFDSGETPLAGVTIQLQGVDDLGRTVVLTATTDANGVYQFQNLRAGAYSILETQPEGYFDGQDFAGTINGETRGMVDNDRLFDIFLGPDEAGINYNFTELFQAD